MSSDEGLPTHRRRRRLIAAAAAILLAALLFTRTRDATPPPPAPPAGGHVVFADTAGWYGRTSGEVALRSTVDWSLGALPAALPLDIGAWVGEDRAEDPAVDIWLRDPEVSIARTYRRADGALVWLTAFGSRGGHSYHLFEHTPETCYPLGGWAIEAFDARAVRLPRGPRPLSVNFGTAQKSGTKGELVFLYFYLWDHPGRDPERGVVSLRLAAPVRGTSAETAAMLTDDFLPSLFPATLAWRRF
ncbi:MAG: exosortase-associated EpsI family protein [Ardenticatenales bacterium]|nr:exosortase-associated EpsI family protein [Ardenticatenales bacterium]